MTYQSSISDNEIDVFARKIPVYSKEEFQLIAGQNTKLLKQHPCIVDGFVTRWKAFDKWQDLDYLSGLFGVERVRAGAPQFVTHENAARCEVSTTFNKYIEYIKRPRRAKELFTGEWTHGSHSQFDETGIPLYSGSLRIIKTKHCSILKEFEPLVPPPLQCWNGSIPFYYQVRNHFWLYVSLPGSITPLHADNNSVIAYLAQLKGVKKAILYSPADASHYVNAGGYMDPYSPDSVQYPSWRKAKPWKATLMPGQLLIWGPNWAHHVVTMENSISISADIVNETNIQQYARSQDWARGFAQIVSLSPQLLDRYFSEISPMAVPPIDTSAQGRDLMAAVLRSMMPELELPGRLLLKYLNCD